MYISKIKCVECEKPLDFKNEAECKDFCEGKSEEHTSGMCKKCGDELFLDIDVEEAVMILRKMRMH